VRILFVLDQIDYEPQGIMQLSSVLKAAGHEVGLAVAALEDPIETARNYQPAIVAYSVITGSQRYYLDLNRTIKQSLEVYSVFGGPHPTFFPEMIEQPGVDAVCIGEGEGAIVDLANAIERDGFDFDPHIPNWHFRRNGETIRNDVRPYINLDDLPLPDRDLIYSKDAISRRSKIKHFIAGRGCPYNCTYCFNHAFMSLYRGKGKPIRHRSVERVIQEVLEVRERYPLEFVVFLDDTFILNKDWLQEFADAYAQKVGLPFFCNVRANLVTHEIAGLLKRAGCHSVSMGVEAGNDTVRNELLRRHMTREQILNAAECLRAAGLRFSTTNMIGLPNTSLAHDIETLDINIACRPDYAHVFLFQPYPRTPLGQYAYESGLIEGSFDDISKVAWDYTILKFPPQHKRALVNLQRLFAIAVEWPWLKGLIVRLLAIRCNRLLWLIHKLWKGYALKQRLHPVRMSVSDLLATAWRFMRAKS